MKIINLLTRFIIFSEENFNIFSNFTNYVLWKNPDEYLIFQIFTEHPNMSPYHEEIFFYTVIQENILQIFNDKEENFLSYLKNSSHYEFQF